MTHTFATLDIAGHVWDEIAARLKAAGYGEQVDGDTIDMHGIGLVKSDRKRASETPQARIFPGAHGPLQSNAAAIMRAVMQAIQETYPGWEITLFLAEKYAPAGAQRLPRFNYASTAARADMVAVLEAFIAKNKAEAPKLNRISDDPPTETRQ
jgi:hypothetical protein